MSPQSATPGASSLNLEPMMEMNMTPLIDVMLVLIIMLIITIPKQNHSIALNLPNGPSVDTKPDVVTLDVDFDGTVLWEGVVVANRVDLESKLTALAAAAKPAELHVRANKLVAYKFVAGVMASAKRKGILNLGLVGNEQFI